MAVRDLLWACPVCRAHGGIRPEGKREVCRSCGAAFRRSRGARILAEHAASRQERSAREWLAMLGPVTAPPADDDGVILGPERVRVKLTRGQEPLHWAGQLVGWVEKYGGAQAGLMTLRSDGLHFLPDRSSAPDSRGAAGDAAGVTAVYWGPADISGLQPASSSLQLGLHSRMASVQFLEGSVRLWTRALSDLLQRHYMDLGRDVLELNPCVRTCPLRRVS